MGNEEDQRKLQSLMLQIRSYQNALEQYSRQSALTERAIEEISVTLAAIEELPKEKGSEALIPIGAGVYVRANITDKENLLVAVSSDISLEKTGAEAKEYLEEKRTRMEKDAAALRAQADKISAELERANKTAEELYSSIQSE